MRKNNPTPFVARIPSAPVASVGLYHLFQELRERPFFFVELGGNEGDKLIFRGADKLGYICNLDVTRLSTEEFLSCAKVDKHVVVYIHGGGGFNPVWSKKVVRAFHHAMKHDGVVIQGPQTYWSDVDFLMRELGTPAGSARCERLVVMAREQVSFDLLKLVLPSHVEAVLDHDTALNLQREDLEQYIQPHSGGYKLFAIREDKEASDLSIRPYFSPWLDPVKSGGEFAAWVRLHGGAREIVANRLHSSICGSILGIPTTLLPNSYFKNRAVWEYSLKDRGVEWAESLDVGHTSRIVHRLPALRRLLRRRRVRRVMQKLHGLD